MTIAKDISFILNSSNQLTPTGRNVAAGPYTWQVASGERMRLSNAGGLSVGTITDGVAGEIRATNEITAYYSDRRLKDNVRIIDNPIEKVLSLNGILYTPNTLAETFGYDINKKLVGLFADEVEAVLPEAVRPAPFDQDLEGNSISGENYRTVQYEKIVPLLIEAIKAQQEIINQISQRLENMAVK
jgi:hypothetical protein